MRIQDDDEEDGDSEDYDSDELDTMYSNEAKGAHGPSSPVPPRQAAIKQEGTGRGAKRKLTPEPSPGPVAQKVGTMSSFLWLIAPLRPPCPMISCSIPAS